MNDFILVKLKEIVYLQNIIKKHDLNYKSERGKTYNIGKHSSPIAFLRDIYEVYLLLEDADDK